MQINIELTTYLLAETMAKSKGISVEVFIANLILDHARKVLKLTD